VRVLGRETLEGLSFLKEHVQLDVGHTALNTRLMEELLQLMPENARMLAELGAQALDIYLRFLGDCMHSAEDSLWSPTEAVA
jgi:pyrroloquinoline quinone (PQQ) biosynthesis protein C